MATDWLGLLNTGLNVYSALNTSSKNQTAAQNYGTATQYNPFNIAMPNSSAMFNGNNAVAGLSPEYSALQKQLTSGAGGFLGGLSGLQANGGINQFLQGNFDQYNQMAPQSTVGNINQSLPQQQQAWNTQQISTGMGDQFNATGSGFLGSLGSFDPNQVAQSYTNNLRQQAQPQNQRAAEGLAQQLFNSGRLGSTGGSNLFGELVNQQNQQDLGFQLAGQQYGGQEQNRLAGLAQGFGQLGTGINSQYAQLNDQFANSGFNRAMQYNDTGFNRAFSTANAQFDQGNQRAQQRFANAMNLFGAGQQNQQGTIQNGLGLLQGSQGLDQNLLQAIGLGGNLGAQKSGVNQAAYQPGLESTVAKNNTTGAAIGGLLGGIQDSGLLDSLKQWYGDNYGQIGEVKPKNGVGKIATPSAPPNPNSAGGEAAKAGSGFLAGLPADTSGIGYVTPTVDKTPPSQSVGKGSSTTAPKGVMDTSGQGLLNTAGNVAGLYSGIKEGGAMGYGKAAGSAASLAGYDIPGAGYLGAIDKAANGDFVGGVYDAAVTYAGPVAQIMDGIANAFNKNKDKREAASGAWWDEFVKSSGVASVFPKAQIYQLPDGTVFQASGEYIKRIGNAVLNKDQDGLQAAVKDMISNKQDIAKLKKLVPAKYFKYPIKEGP